jgi:DNA-binding IclR family transcriptional regulator
VEAVPKESGCAMVSQVRQRWILRLIRDYPGIQPSGLHRATGLTATECQEVCHLLWKKGLVERSKTGRWYLPIGDPNGHG